MSGGVRNALDRAVDVRQGTFLTTVLIAGVVGATLILLGRRWSQ